MLTIENNLFDPRFFQNENFTGTDDFYVEGRDV